MREVISNNKMVVWDNVLEDQEFGGLLTKFSETQFQKQHNTNWEKVWHPGDGEVLRSSTSLYSCQMPAFKALQPLHDIMMQQCKDHPELCGKFGVDWHYLILSMYIYPAGSRLSWHGDGVEYTAALTYYCHTQWSPHWGGELLVANTPPLEMMPKVDYEVLASIDHRQLDAFINAFGVGHMIVPKPNRMVLMKSGTCHMVNRVDQAAGDHLRMSVVAFTRKDYSQKETNVAMVKEVVHVG